MQHLSQPKVCTAKEMRESCKFAISIELHASALTYSLYYALYRVFILIYEMRFLCLRTLPAAACCKLKKKLFFSCEKRKIFLLFSNLFSSVCTLASNDVGRVLFIITCCGWSSFWLLLLPFYFTSWIMSELITEVLSLWI